MYLPGLPRIGRTTLLATASLCLGFALLVGCDDASADKQVRAELHKAYQHASAGTAEGLTQAKQVLDTAAANANASPAVQANAKALLAQVELEAARAAQRNIDERMMDVARHVADIAQLAQQISTTNALIAGYKQYDPRETLAAIQKNIADATGGPDKPAWFTHENTQIPTLAVLKQDVARLEGEIAKLDEQLKQLNAKRSEVLQQAEQASREAEAAPKGQNLDAFNRASDLRKQAADLAVEIDRTQAAMTPFRSDLAIAQSQQQVVEAFIADQQKQAEAQTRGWQMIQQQMGAQNGLARAILQGAGTSGGGGNSPVPSGGAIADKAAQLNKVMAEIKELREQALSNARAADEHYGQAVTLAEQLRQDLETNIREPKNSSRPEQTSWKALRDVMHPASFRMHQADAKRTLAGILGTEAMELTLRMDLRNLLQPILEAAGLTVPDELQATNVEREREQRLTDANASYKEADELLQNITEGQAQESVQNAAYVARLLTLYAWSQLNRQSGDTQGAQERLELAQQVKNTLVERQIPLPALPEALGGAHPATAPATAPAETPATAPASGDQPG